jgi:hypothetical protein
MIGRTKPLLFCSKIKHVTFIFFWNRMAAALAQTLHDLRALNPHERQEDICNQWIEMNETVTFEGETIEGCPDWSSPRQRSHIFTNHRSHGHPMEDIFHMIKDVDTTLTMEVWTMDIGEKNWDWFPDACNRMFGFDRVGQRTEIYDFHQHLDNGKTHRVLWGTYYIRKYEQEEAARKLIALSSIPYSPCYLFYRTEVIPPPWEWMLRKGTFLQDFYELNPYPEPDAYRITSKHGLMKISSNNMLLQVKWYHSFALLYEVIQNHIGLKDLFLPIMNFLCILQTQEVSYAHSNQRKTFESKWTKEDHVKNERIRGQLYDMLDGFYNYTSPERPKKRQRLV